MMILWHLYHMPLLQCLLRFWVNRDAGNKGPAIRDYNRAAGQKGPPLCSMAALMNCVHGFNRPLLPNFTSILHHYCFIITYLKFHHYIIITSLLRIITVKMVVLLPIPVQFLPIITVIMGSLLPIITRPIIQPVPKVSRK